MSLAASDIVAAFESAAEFGWCLLGEELPPVRSWHPAPTTNGIRGRA